MVSALWLDSYCVFIPISSSAFLLRTSLLIRAPFFPPVKVPQSSQSKISTAALSWCGEAPSCHMTEGCAPTRPPRPAVCCFIKRADRQSNLRLIMLLLSIDCAACCSPFKCAPHRNTLRVKHSYNKTKKTLWFLFIFILLSTKSSRIIAAFCCCY